MASLNFKRKPEEARGEEYPPIGDQLDALMKGFKALSESGVSLPPETEEWLKKCNEVKLKYPKE